MRLQVHDVNLSSGGPLIVIINKEDASKLDILPLSRLKIKKENNSITVVVDIAEDSQIKPGKIGFFEEVLTKLNLKDKDYINVEIEERPKSIDYIKKKLKGSKLNFKEINTIIKDIVQNRLSEIEITYFVSACYTNKLTIDESVSLTRAIVANGNQLNLNKKIVVDKHSVSGVPGNRTTMIIVPILAAAGLTVPKTSSRAITSASTTYDTPILIKKDKIKIIKIGEFVDKYFNNQKKQKKSDKQYIEIKNSKYKVPVFDNNFKISFKPITGVFRHENYKQLLNLTLETGRTAKVTEDHSLFTLSNGKIFSKQTKDFEIGDIIVVPRKIPEQEEIKEINLIKEMLEKLSEKELDNIFIEGLDRENFREFLVNKNPRDHMRFYKSLLAMSLLKKKNLNLPKNIKLRNTDSELRLYSNLKITKELIKLLGYYAAEGHCNKWSVEYYLGTHEKEIINDIKECSIKVFGINPKIKQRKTKETETDVIIPGKLISLLFQKIFEVGNKSYEKRIPDIIFNINKELQKEYLSAYIKGDGNERSGKNTGLEATTVSKALINGLQYLSIFTDIYYNTRINKNIKRDFGSYISNCLPSYKFYTQKEILTKPSTAFTNQIPIFESGLSEISNLNYNLLNSENNNFKLGFKIKNQKTISFDFIKRGIAHLEFSANENIKNFIKLINGDLSFLKIKKIEKVRYNKKYVYDLSIKGYENFIGGEGPIFLHNSGTADTMEVLAPVNLTIKQIKNVVEKTNACMVWGGALELASADDKIIKIERPLSLDPEGILLSSILAKKKAVNATHVLIDIPYGKEAKIESKARALNLKKKFMAVSKKIGLKVKVVLTKTNQNIGNGIGPALEARDVMEVLAGRGPQDLRKKSIFLANEIFKMVGKKPIAVQLLDSGKALGKMIEIIKAQGGEINHIKLAKYKINIKSPKPGKIVSISNNAVSHLARIAGAPEDKQAGLYIYVNLKDKVKRGQLLFTVYTSNLEKLAFIKESLKDLEVMKIS